MTDPIYDDVIYLSDFNLLPKGVEMPTTTSVDQAREWAGQDGQILSCLHETKQFRDYYVLVRKDELQHGNAS